MSGNVQRAAAMLLLVIFVAAVFGPASVVNAGDDTQGTGHDGLTVDTIDELVARFTADAELTIPARGERYVGTAEISRYLESAVPQGRSYTLVSANRSGSGFVATVDVADRGVRWGRLMFDATVVGTELTRLEVTGIRLLLWPG